MQKSILFKKAKVNFSDTGRGRVVVLLHGFLGSHKIWDKTTLNLSTSYRVIAIDLPGHGSTDNFGYVHTMDLMARCVKAVLESLNLKRYVIIGHSMGGYVGLAFAELFPDNLRGLCLFHSTAYADTEEKKVDRNRAIKIVKLNPNMYTTEVIKNLFATKHVTRLKTEIAFAQKIASTISKQSIISALEGMKDRPNRDIILGLVEYPVMMIIGELDNVLPYQQLLDQSNVIKKKHVLYLEQEGHMGFLENPTVCNKKVRKFLRTCFK